MEMIYNQPMKYKEICELMGDEKVQGGKNKKCQLNKWRKEYEIIKEGTFYTVLHKYTDEEKDFNFNLKMRKTIKDPLAEKAFNIFEYKDKHRAGIYKVQLDNEIYIGETIDLYSRFAIHWNYDILPTYRILHNGGEFSVLEFMDGATEQELMEREEYYIQLYANNENYICLNKRRNINVVPNSKSKSRFLRIKLDKYEEAYQLLKEHDCLFEKGENNGNE